MKVDAYLFCFRELYFTENQNNKPDNIAPHKAVAYRHNYLFIFLKCKKYSHSSFYSSIFINDAILSTVCFKNNQIFLPAMPKQLLEYETDFKQQAVNPDTLHTHIHTQSL